MSPQVTSEIAVTETKKPATKTAKKVPAKAKTAKAAAKLTRKTSTDSTPAERQLKVLKAMRSLQATSAGAAQTAEAIAAKSGLTKFDVYGQLYHTHELVTEGFAKIVKLEGQRGLSYHLTAKGAKRDPE